MRWKSNKSQEAASGTERRLQSHDCDAVYDATIGKRVSFYLNANDHPLPVTHAVEVFVLPLCLGHRLKQGCDRGPASTYAG